MRLPEPYEISEYPLSALFICIYDSQRLVDPVLRARCALPTKAENSGVC
jgi:hypothetical protein